MMIDLAAMFEKHQDEFLAFDKVEAPRHQRRDIAAFLMLHDLCPMKPNRIDGRLDRDMVSAAQHDEIWLDASPEELAKNATEADIVTLIRCGIRLDEHNEAFCMFV